MIKELWCKWFHKHRWPVANAYGLNGYAKMHGIKKRGWFESESKFRKRITAAIELPNIRKHLCDYNHFDKFVVDTETARVKKMGYKVLRWERMLTTSVFPRYKFYLEKQGKPFQMQVDGLAHKDDYYLSA